MKVFRCRWNQREALHCSPSHSERCPMLTTLQYRRWLWSLCRQDRSPTWNTRQGWKDWMQHALVQQRGVATADHMVLRTKTGKGCCNLPCFLRRLGLQNLRIYRMPALIHLWCMRNGPQYWLMWCSLLWPRSFVWWWSPLLTHLHCSSSIGIQG